MILMRTFGTKLADTLVHRPPLYNGSTVCGRIDFSLRAHLQWGFGGGWGRITMRPYLAVHAAASYPTPLAV